MKFRVWRKYFEEDGVPHYGEWMILNFVINASGTLYLGPSKVDPEQYVLQRSTGCTDLNGKEVFEGDIIGGQAEMVFLMTGQKTGEIEQVRKEIVWSQKHNGWSARCLRTKHEYAGGINISLQFYPVIGNVCENPELLNF